jgi:hypothetical protein
MTGNLTCTTSGANLKWGNITIYGGGSNGGINSLLVGDDVTIGDCNLGGIMGMKSTGNNAGFKFFNSSGTSIGGLQSTNGTLQWQNASGTFYNIIHSGNIGSQSVNYATSAGSATKATKDSDGNAINTTYLKKSGGTLTNELISKDGGIWVQGGSNAGSNKNRMSLVSGMPSGLAYNTSKRGVRIYSNAIAFADPYNGNNNNDSGWIRHIEETANSGVLEIAVGDDGNEEIRFRRYNTSSNIVSDVLVPNTTGTLALTSQLPAASSWGTPSNNTCSLNIRGTSKTVSLAGHTHSYLPLSGGTMTGIVTISVGGYALRWGTESKYTLGSNGPGDFYIWGESDADLRLGTNNTERIRIKSGGNVGIGTSNPTEKLEVNGNIKTLGTVHATAGIVHTASGSSSLLQNWSIGKYGDCLGLKSTTRVITYFYDDHFNMTSDESGTFYVFDNDHDLTINLPEESLDGFTFEFKAINHPINLKVKNNSHSIVFQDEARSNRKEQRIEDSVPRKYIYVKGRWFEMSYHH